METVFIIIHLVLTLTLILLVLVQRSSQDGLAGMAGSSTGRLGSGLVTTRSKGNAVTKATAVMAALFMCNSLFLAIIAAHESKHSVVDSVLESNKKEETSKEKTTPTVPLAE